MASKDYPDPLTAWFRRNRHWLALACAALLVSGQVVDLILDRTLSALINVLFAAAFWGTISWSWGSRMDRSSLRYWSRLLTAWGTLLGIELALLVASLARDTWRPSWLITIGFTTLLLFSTLIPFRRIRRGQPWPPVPEKV